MVSIYKTEKTRGNYIMTELRGLSTDEKPVMFEENVIDNGSTYTEIDTGDVYMYDLVNASWNKISGNGGGGTMEKFDYVIPAGLYEDLEGEITNEDIISVLEEIDDNYLDENNNVKPLLIGAYLGNDDQSMEGFFTTCVQIGTSGGHVCLMFVSYLDSGYIVYVNYHDSSWHYSHNYM